MKNPFIVIPAYNEEGTIGKVIIGLKKAGYRNIIVVDDGSKDMTSKIVQKEKVILYEHEINRGLGGALGTGIEGALQNNAGIILTFDADGQHDVKDIPRMIAPIISGKADVVIGSRLLNPKGMPWFRILENYIGNFVTFVLFGKWVSDSQSGMRAFSRKAAQAMEIKTNRMEVSSEIIREIKRNKLRLKEVPIKPIYTKYSLSKGQSLSTGFKTAFKLFLRRIMN